MSFFFRKSKSISDSGILAGAADWHSHILPGVDDGIASVEDALDALRRFEAIGVSKIWLTPHVMEDFPNSTADLKARFNDLCEAYSGPIQLSLASENMLDSLFEERLENNDFLPLGDAGRHLLVETSYINPPYGMEEMIEGVTRLGLTPVLAHPERYRYMEQADYSRWRKRGLLFQCNLASFVGAYGETARKKAEWLLRNKMVDLLGSDLHRSSFFENMDLRLPSGCIPELASVLGKSEI